MAISKKRKDGRYVRKAKGKYFYGKTIKEAEKARDEYILKCSMADRNGLRTDRESFTVEEYAKAWLPIAKPDVTERVYKQYELYLNNFCKKFGNYKLIDIYPTIIKSYFNTLIGKSASTIRINKQIITAMFESAYIDEITNRNPCKNIKTPEGKKGSHRNLDITEIRTIIKLTNYHRLGPFVTFCLFTGMRRGEALAFNVNNNINFDNNTINIDKAIRFNSNQLILTSTKTKAGVRTIPLFKPAKEAIANKDGLLLDKNGSYPTLSTFERAWESYMKLFEEEINGITKREYNKKLKSGVNAFKKWENHSFRHHDLRHTFCTMLFNSNVDIKTAQKWMGHSDPETTLKIYTHLSEEKEKQSELAVNANILNDYINQQF